MTRKISSNIRQTAIISITAFAILAPGAAMAGPFDKIKSKVQGSVTHLSNVSRKIKQNRPVANLVKKVTNNNPAGDIFELVDQFKPLHQVKDSVALMLEIQKDYRGFAGGAIGCKGECKDFRAELKATFADYIALVEEVPVLENQPGLYENIVRVSNLIDYVPARALYPMWQALDGQLYELRMGAEKIREMLSVLPPLEDMSDFMLYAKAAGTYTKDSPFCAWANSSDKLLAEWVAAELKRITWLLGKVEGFVPDLGIQIHVGGTAGVAVVNGQAEGGFQIKITDAVKLALKVLATVPEFVAGAIEINILRAKVLCAGAAQASKF